MKSFKIITLLIVGFFFFTACEDNKEEVPDPQEQEQEQEQIKDVSFANDVKPIFDANCVGCHGNSSSFGGYNFESFSNLSNHVSDAALLGAIKHESGFSPMPQGGSKLSNTNIEKIEVWINEGAQNN